MPQTADSSSDPETSAQADAQWSALGLSRSQKVVLVVDVVESVRLMEHDEVLAVKRWRAFLLRVTTEVLPETGGRLVKSLGDGLMLEFEQAESAIRAAHAMHRIAGLANVAEAQTAPTQFALRVGAHQTEVYTDDIDIYGRGVNLAARLAAMANPGETVVTCEVRDAITDGLDARVHDLGLCYFKHVQEPVRAWRLGPAHEGVGQCQPNPTHDAQQARLASDDYERGLRTALTILPFACATPMDVKARATAHLLADGLIAQLSRTPELRVTSRMSTQAFLEKTDRAALAAQMLAADFVLDGRIAVQGLRLNLSYRLTAHQGQSVSGGLVLEGHASGGLDDLCTAQSQLVAELAQQVHSSVVAAQGSATQHVPMANLSGYALLLGGVQSMYRASSGEFGHARQLLEALHERFPRSPLASAWLAKWYVLNRTRGQSTAPAKEQSVAQRLVETAVERDPTSSFAAAVRGFVQLHLLGDPEAANTSLRAAQAINPSDAFAHLFHAIAAAETEDVVGAVASAEQALLLSPLDPFRHYFLSLAASANLTAGQFSRAVVLCNDSLRLNQHHAPTLRALIHALVSCGQTEEAKPVAIALMRLQPQLTVETYLGPAGQASPRKLEAAQSLQAAGIPVR